MRRPAARLVALAFASLAAFPARAQQPDAEVPRASRVWALTNARVTTAPGRTLERATVVIRDGLIEAVGRDVRIPFDAQRIAADSFHVYAGFVDGLGQVGFSRPRTEPGPPPRVPDPANPPRDRAGLQPERLASAMLAVDDASIDAHRKAGFGAVHTVPYGGFLPGRGALLLLSGATPQRLVLRDDVSTFAQFQNARGVYPATPMAIMAAWRDLYRETARRGTLRDEYTRGPNGRERVAVDPSYDALAAVVAGRQPVFFQVSSGLEAYRAMRLQRELGFKLVLSGLPDASENADAIKRADVPVLLTLNLPESKNDSARSTPYVPTYQTGTYANVAGERANLEARQRAARTQYDGAAGALHRAGVRFGFSTLGAKPADVMRNVRRMIAAGLPQDAALAALTTAPAEILGLDRQLGTVEPGKIANLVVTTRPLFDSKAAVRYVFVDGERYRYELPAAAPARPAGGAGGTAATAAAVLGTWSYEVESPQGVIGGVLTLTGPAESATGTITNAAFGADAQALTAVSVSGNTAVFTFNGGPFGTVSASVTADGDALSGTFTVAQGSVPVRGTRRPN